MTRRVVFGRFRALAFATVLATTSFAVVATPTSTPSGGDPLGRIVDTVTHSEILGQIANALHRAVAPQSAWAYCASNATFTGYLTSSPTSHVALTRTTDLGVFAYISRVDTPFSCTAFYRYSGVAWNTTATAGFFDYGNLIKSTSVSCNFVTGSNDYVKANHSTDCPDTDAEYAMLISLGAERTYVQGSHDAVGRMTFVHSSCSTYYESGTDTGEKVKGGEGAAAEDFTGGNVNNRPGANCASMTIDGLNASPSQTIIYDKTAPSLSFSAPSGSAGTIRGSSSTSFTVSFSATDALAGFGAAHPWTLQRQVAPNIGAGACGTFANDTSTGSVVTGTTNASGQTSAQTVVTGYCYRWILSGTDMNGNPVGSTASATSATLIVDGIAPALSFVAPHAPTITRTGSSISYQVSWVENESGSGIATRSLQRYKVAASTPICAGTFAADGAADANASPLTQTLAAGNCYHWAETLTDLAGRLNTCTSGDVFVSASYPSASFTAPADGTLAYQTGTSLNVTWTEATGGGTIASRSLQRQKASGTMFSCTGLGWTNDGSADTGVSPRNNAGLAEGLYRWTQTATNSGGNTGASASGWLVVDTTAPVGTIETPAANQPVTGNVVITGTAYDTGSFKDYLLEYGVGATPSTWLPIGTFGTPQTAAGSTLATWSPGALSGVYSIRLTVRQNASSATSVTTHTVVLENGGRGDESWLTRVPYDLGGGFTLDVGVANGELRLGRDLGSIPSYGPPQGLSLAYSSSETSATGKLGVGWSSNLTQYLTFETASVTTWHRTDGGREPFGLVGSTWTPPHGHFETMSTAGTEVTITRKDQSRLVFESSGAGRLKRIENRFAKALTIIWSAAGATVSDTSGRGPAAGQTYNLLYDSGNARITSYIDYAGRTWSFGYTGTGASSDLTCITDPVLKVTRLSYASHALTGIVRGGATCASGGTATWTVGYTSGRVTSVKSPTVTHPDVFATPPDGSVTWSQVVDDTTPDYATTGWAFDTSGTGRVRIATDPEGGSVSHDYDLDSNVLARSAPTETGLASTTSEYDARGNQTKETKVLDVGTDPVDPSDDTTLVTVWTYNAGNDVVSRTDGDNDAGVRTVTKYTYDVAGHLVSEDRNCTTSGTTIPGQGAGGACTGAGTQNADTNVITNYAYSINDQLAFEQDPMGRVTKHIYDSYGNETSTIANCTTSGTTPPSPFDTCTGAGTADATTNVVTSSAFLATDVDGKAGLPTSSTDALVRTTTYDYDALGRLKSEALPGDASIPALTRTMTFDEYGNTLTETEAWTDPRDSTAQTRVTTHTYDAESQETVVVDPTNQTETATTYDPAGNVDATTVRSVDGLIVVSVTTDGYDRASRQTEEAVVGADATATTKRKYTTLSAVALTTLPDGTQQRATVRFDGAATATELLPADADANDPGATVLSTDGATFDILGRETATDDGDADTANDTTTTYDRLGRVLTTGPTGALSTFTYDRAGNQLTSTDAAGIATTTTYDPLNRAVVVIANDVATPLGPTDDVTTTTWYDAAGNLIAARDPRGITTRTVVNARDMTSETIADCTDTGTLTPSTNPPACTGGTPTLTANVKTDLSYDGQGNVTKTVSAVGLGSPYQATMETAYDAAGRVQATLDPRGTITRNIYNTAGQLTDSYLNCTTSGTTVPTTFPAWAQCTGGGANDGTYNVRTRYAYDDLGNVITVTAPNGRKTVTELDADNRVSATVENWVDGVFSSASPTEDVRTTYAYDDAGRRAAVVAPTADGTGTVVTRTIYNPDGTVASEIRNCTDSPVGAPEACTGTAGPSAAANLTTSYVYDARGNVIKQASPDPSATSGGSSATITTASAFEADNRLCRVVENATAGTDLQALAHPCSDATQDAGTLTTNLSTRYGYDGIGNLTSMVDAAGNTTTYGYDAAGHPTGRTDAQSGALAWTYDDIGNRTAQRNRIDPVLTTSVAWTYDPFGRMLSRTADSATTSGTYDMSGNKLTATSAIGTITATYDRLNRVLTVDDEDAGSTADTTYTYALSSSSWSDPRAATRRASTPTTGRPR